MALSITCVNVAAVAAVFVIFIGKYYIEMLMSETFFQSIALLDYTYFSIDCELIALCLACISCLLLLFVVVVIIYPRAVDAIVAQLFLSSFRFIVLLLFFNVLSVDNFVPSLLLFFSSLVYAAYASASAFIFSNVCIAFLCFHFILFIYHIFL